MDIPLAAKPTEIKIDPKLTLLAKFEVTEVDGDLELDPVEAPAPGDEAKDEGDASETTETPAEEKKEEPADKTE